MKYADFDAWFYEQQGFSLRAERAYVELDGRRVVDGVAKMWLQAAFDAGRATVQPSASRLYPCTACDATGAVWKQGDAHPQVCKTCGGERYLSVAPDPTPAPQMTGSHSVACGGKRFKLAFNNRGECVSRWGDYWRELDGCWVQIFHAPWEHPAVATSPTDAAP